MFIDILEILGYSISGCLFNQRILSKYNGLNITRSLRLSFWLVRLYQATDGQNWI